MASVGEIKASLSIEGADTVQKELRNVGDSFKNVGKKAGSIGDRFKDVGGKIQNVGGKVSSTGDKLTKGFSLPLAGASGIVSKFAMDFEKDFAKVNTLLGDTTDLKAYKQEMTDSAKEMGIGLDEYSEAVYGSISAGVEQGEAVKFTADAVKLAKGGFTDTATSVDVMTTALNSYGMGADEATKVSDYLVTAQNEGKTTVDELASSMGKVIPIASENNVQMDSLSSAYAVLTKNGIATSEAGTMIKAMFGELGKSGSEVDKTLKEISGKSFKELTSEGKSVTDVLGMLDEHAQANGGSLGDMFGSMEAGTSAMTLAKDGGQQFTDTMAQMDDSAGATEKAFEKMTDTSAFKFEQAMNSMKVSATEIGTALAPVIETVADLLGTLSEKVAEGAEWFEGLSVSQQKTIVVIGGILAAIPPLLSVFGRLIKIGGKITSNVGTLIKTFSKFKGIATKVGTGLKVLWGIVMAHPFVAIGVAVVALVVLIIANWDKVWAFTQKVWGAIKPYLVALWNGIVAVATAIFNGLVAFFKGAWQLIVNTATALWNGLVAVLKAIWNGIVAVAKAVFNGLMAYYSFMWNAIKTTAIAVWNVLISGLKAIWNGLVAVGKAVFNGFMATVKAIWETLKSVSISLWNGLVSSLKAVWNGLVSTGKALFTGLMDTLKNIWSMLKTATMSVWNALVSGVKSIVKTLVRAVVSVITGLKNTLTGIWNGIKSVASSVWGGIKTSISNIVGGIVDVAVNLFNGAKDKISGIWNGIKDTISDAIDGAKDAVSGAVDAIKGIMDFDFSLPELKMPNIDVSMKKNSWGIPYPDFDVSWFATGGIATGPSVVGVGEAGDEAILPLSNKSKMKPFAQAVSSMMSDENGGSGNNDGDGGNTFISGNKFVIREEADIKKVAEELHKLDKRKRRPKGK